MQEWSKSTNRQPALLSTHPSAASNNPVPTPSRSRDKPQWNFIPALKRSTSTMDKIFNVQTRASGPTGHLPLESDFLTHAPSGHIFGWTQDAAMGWSPSDLGKDEYLILS